MILLVWWLSAAPMVMVPVERQVVFVRVPVQPEVIQPTALTKRI